MNSLRFEVRHALDDSDVWRVCVPVIDEVSLIDRLREFERRLEKAEGTSEVAGEYDGLPLFNVALPSEHWYGGKSVYGLEEGRSVILGCECGVVDCWPFHARIEVTDAEVKWTDFLQPYRAKPSDRSIWDCSSFPSFTFSRRSYDEAIRSLPPETFGGTTILFSDA